MWFRVKSSGADFVDHPVAGGGDLFVEGACGGVVLFGLPVDALPALATAFGDDGLNQGATLANKSVDVLVMEIQMIQILI